MNVPSWLPLQRGLAEPQNTSRADVRVDVNLVSEHNFWWDLHQRVADGGLFIATHRLRARGSRLLVNIRLPDNGEPILALTEVAWHRQDGDDDVTPGLGLRFLIVDSAALARIQLFTRRREPMLFEP